MSSEGMHVEDKDALVNLNSNEIKHKTKIFKKLKTQFTDLNSALASFSVENKHKIMGNNNEIGIKIRPKSSAFHQNSSSNLKDGRHSVQNLILKKNHKDSSENLNTQLKIVRLSNSRSNCQSNLSSQKDSSREKIKIQNLAKLGNLKDKLLFKGNV